MKKIKQTIKCELVYIAMPKKSSAKKSIKQRQEQQQNITIKIGELKKKKPRRRPRKGPKAPGSEAPLRQLPPVVYQTLPQLVGYNPPQPTITAPPKPPTSIVAPVKAKTTILEDVGVGTEGFVEILERPTKRETLAELITPVDIPRMQIDPVEEGSMFDIPRMQVDPVEQGSMFDIPRMQIDPVEEGPMFGLFAKETRSSITDEPELRTSIVETKAKSTSTKSGKSSRKQKQERPISPLSTESSMFGLPSEYFYIERQPAYASPKPQRSEPTLFRSNTPKRVFTQKTLNKFFEPRKRDTSPKPLPKGGIIEPAYSGETRIIRRPKAIV
jgi:hypothetical protein